MGYAQNVSQEKQYSLGTSSQFLDGIQQQLSDSKTEGMLKLNISDRSFLMVKTNYRDDKIKDKIHLEGEVIGGQNGNFIIDFNKNKLEGNIILPKIKKAYTYFSDPKGNIYIKETDINKLICIDYLQLADAEKRKSVGVSEKTTTLDVSNLQSYPGAAGCLLLDFDGYNLPAGGGWNGGVALQNSPSGMSSSEIQEAWEIAAEDFRAFGLNVTTNESVFNSYPINKRVRCVITSTSTVAPGYGGIAYVNDFSQPFDRACWAFTSGVGTSGKVVGEVISHELGHTLGLSHDGSTTETYYGGSGNWAPIMGLSYYRNVTQWSRGEYAGAVNKQDDLAIISGATNAVGYRVDNHGNTITNASPLHMLSGQISSTALENHGIIENTGDIDVFSFETIGGNINLNINAALKNSDLRIQASLYNAHNVLIISASAIPTNLGAPIVIQAILAPGKYYLSITGIADGDGVTGYSNYASLGGYSISGSVPISNAVRKEETSISYQIYPNPVQDILTIDLGSAEGKHQIKIFDNSGQIIYNNFTSDKTHNVSLMDKPTGIYLVSIENYGTGISKMFHLVKK